jgi:hypothetical protein
MVEVMQHIQPNYIIERCVGKRQVVGIGSAMNPGRGQNVRSPDVRRKFSQKPWPAAEFDDSFTGRAMMQQPRVILLLIYTPQYRLLLPDSSVSLQVFVITDRGWGHDYSDGR